jgi:histidine triad (HIT) family protein
MDQCAFCRIVRGEALARVVWSSADAVAFLPPRPATKGHTLVVPRQHVPDLWSIDWRLGPSLMTAVVEVGRAVGEAMRPDGMNLITSAGVAASQTIFHLHLHVVPRWDGDRIGHIWPPDAPWSEAALDETALDETATLIRAAVLLLEGVDQDEDEAE